MIVCCNTLHAAPAAESFPVTTAPTLDGVMDEACWSSAVPVTNFTQVLPVTGAPPSERTELRFLVTKDSLFIGIRCFDSTPRGIIARKMLRDAELNGDDLVRISFDTFGRGRDGYVFEVNPNGARRDGLFGKFGRRGAEFDASWDGIWDARARIDEHGWCAEIAIPSTSLAFDPSSAHWRWNFERIIARKRETIRWRGISPTKDLGALEDFGPLEGTAILNQGRGIEIKPYVRSDFREGGENEGFSFDSGFDVTWRITPSLSLSGTYNTDFAETEVDTRVIELERFPTFYPEKRDFFLQDAPLFFFGGLAGRNIPYYSRRIGLGIDGRPVDIIGGFRLTGRVGRTSIALLDVWQDGQETVEGKNLGVARVSHQILEEASVGGLFTYGDPSSDGDAWLGGADFSWQNSQLSGGRRITSNAFIMHSDADRAGGGASAYGVELLYPNEPFGFDFYFRSYDEDFLPALGYLDRPGTREYSLANTWVWRPEASSLRRISLRAWNKVLLDFDDSLAYSEHSLPQVTFESNTGDELELALDVKSDVLDEPFEIQPGNRIAAGDYRWSALRGEWSGADSRVVSPIVSASLGEFYDGNRLDFGTELAWRPSPHFAASAAWLYSDINLPSGDFDVHLASLRLELAWSPELTWSQIAQYDNLSGNLGLSSRLRWTIQPGNDIFLVFNHSWLETGSRFESIGGDTTFKLGTTLRF